MDEIVKPVKLDEHYMELAYKKAIIQRVIFFLKHTCLPEMGEAPKEQIICEDVIYSNRIVPPAPITDLMDDLQESKKAIQLELDKYRFIRKDIKEDVKAIQPERKEEQKVSKVEKKRRGRGKTKGRNIQPVGIDPASASPGGVTQEAH